MHLFRILVLLVLAEKSAFGRKISFWPILAEKSASVPNNLAPFRDASPPTDLNVTNPAKNQSQFWWRPFFFFFGDHLILGEKNVWISDFGRKITLNFGEDLFFFFYHLNLGEKNVWISDFGRNITLNFGEDIRIFEVLCFKSPPPKFSGSATGRSQGGRGRGPEPFCFKHPSLPNKTLLPVKKDIYLKIYSY